MIFNAVDAVVIVVGAITQFGSSRLLQGFPVSLLVLLYV